MKTVRWGILGAGRIARKFAEDLRFAPSASLQAVGARDLEKARGFAGEFGIPAAHGSYEALVSDPDVDAIYVATPHNFHAEHAFLGFQAGKAVLCEKPLTPTPEESEALIAAAVEHDVYLMEAMWTWFLPSVIKAKAWLDEGRIGELLQVRADFGFPAPFNPEGRLFNPDLAGGAMLDIGIYPLAFNRLMLGQGPEEMRALVRRASTGVDEEVSIVAQTGSVSSLLSCSFRCQLSNMGVLIGTKGRIEVPSFWQSTSAHLYAGDTLVEQFDDDRKGGGFEFEIEAASQDILAGCKQSSVVSHADTLGLQDDMARVLSAGG